MYKKEVNSRIDLSGLVTFSIDNFKTRSLDDCISLEKVSEKIYKLYVHISDVSFFVRKDSDLDAEAEERRESIYIKAFFRPMLPTVISNNLGSLLKKQKRVAISLAFLINSDGLINFENIEILESMVENKAKLSYNSVNQFL